MSTYFLSKGHGSLDKEFTEMLHLFLPSHIVFTSARTRDWELMYDVAQVLLATIETEHIPCVRATSSALWKCMTVLDMQDSVCSSQEFMIFSSLSKWMENRQCWVQFMTARVSYRDSFCCMYVLSQHTWIGNWYLHWDLISNTAVKRQAHSIKSKMSAKMIGIHTVKGMRWL
jgi:hypothetical protein